MKEKNIKENIGVVPYIFYQIIVEMGGNSHIVYSSVKFQNIIGNASLLQKITLEPSRLEIPINGTLEELKYLETRKQVSGMLYSKGHTVKRTEISAQAKTLLDIKSDKSLTGDETIETVTNINSSNSGFSFSLNLDITKFTLGNTNNNNEIKKGTQRIVSRSFINSLVRKYSSDIRINCTSSSNDECEKNIDKVATFIMNGATQHTLKFEEVEKDNWKIGNDIIGYANLSKMQSDEVFKAQPKINIDASNSRSLEKTDAVKVTADDKKNVDATNAAKATSNSTNKSDFSNDIEWTQKGDKWIPSKVNVSLIDTVNLNNSINYSLSNNITSEATKPYVVPFTVLNEYKGNLKYDWGLLSSKIKTHFESCSECLPCALPLEYESK